ncbi:PREDICTED: nuclear pore glycoprotein p62-like, partial [Acropora digitifera]|uniref:nuclear pore glycoprotein p62-like n=1 Tax=Acropora digitifera TaxID=70779 RepID=UPI00077A4393
FSLGVGTITITSSAPSSSTTSSATSSVPQLTYKQLEELINKWTLDLTEYEKTFLDQAAEVNAWDRLLMENGEKITELNAGVENVKAEQDRLDQELDFIMAQQKELEEMLKPLEDAVKDGNTGGRQLQQADIACELKYKLANDIDGQLKQMVQDLKSIIDHLNTSNTQKQDNEDPILQIAKILNAHMNSLQWIDQNSGILQRKVDEISRLSETRRKEQERNFRLAFD